jgi:tetratricopeptide (TPR) repeat protein
MDVLDENGDLIAWFSDDPDDFNSFSDYELKIRRLVIELNEELFSIGSYLLGYDEDNALEYIKLLRRINPNYISVPTIQEKLREIRTCSNYRLTSCHPDELDEPRLTQNAKIAEDYFNKARTSLSSGRIEEAVNLYEKAGLYGHLSGYSMLGTIYKNGLGGIKRDIKKAIEYYEMGAEDEIGDCAFILGRLYRDGVDGLLPDYDLAYKWIREAALLGTFNAGNALGQLFENGWGCEKNLRRSLYWYDVSGIGIENGNRIRLVLSQQKDALPLKLDGFCYETGQLIREPSWWEDYYKKHNMI